MIYKTFCKVGIYGISSLATHITLQFLGSIENLLWTSVIFLRNLSKRCSKLKYVVDVFCYMCPLALRHLIASYDLNILDCFSLLSTILSRAWCKGTPHIHM